MEFVCAFIQFCANQINIIIWFAYEIESANSNLLNVVWLCAKRHIEQFNFLNFILCRGIKRVEFNASLWRDLHLKYSVIYHHIMFGWKN